MGMGVPLLRVPGKIPNERLLFGTDGPGTLRKPEDHTSCMLASFRRVVRGLSDSWLDQRGPVWLVGWVKKRVMKNYPVI